VQRTASSGRALGNHESAIMHVDQSTTRRERALAKDGKAKPAEREGRAVMSWTAVRSYSQ
jgi:hypothetical protein